MQVDVVHPGAAFLDRDVQERAGSEDRDPAHRIAGPRSHALLVHIHRGY
jgi:hypothetical protein